jgi:hypothetical protein
MIERTQQQDHIDAPVGLRKRAGIAHPGAGEGRLRLVLGCRGRLLDVQWYGVDQGHRVAFPGQGQGVDAGSPSDVEHGSRCRGQIAGEQLPRSQVLQASRGRARQTPSLQALLVVGQDLLVQFAPFVDLARSSCIDVRLKASE